MASAQSRASVSHLMIKIPIPRWDIGTILYMKVAPEEGGMLTGYIIRPNSLGYLVTWGDHEEVTHWECELTDERVYSASEKD